MSIFLLTCQNDVSEKAHLFKIQGKTMGTYYIISYFAPKEMINKAQIDQLLLDFNQELSTYIPSSTISRFNKSNKQLENSTVANELQYPLFDKVYTTAEDIYWQTDGYFDPSVMPLVNYWGFGYTPKIKKKQIDSNYVKQLKSLVGFDRFQRIKANHAITYTKTDSLSQIDFSAIAKGYGVDVVADMLEQNNISQYLIDIGGEMKAKGKKPDGKPWTIGITQPKEHAAIDDIVITVPLIDCAIASSGNYRNFYESNGHKYSHTINPKTGFMERNTLLSTSIIAKDCMTADGYATACMVMGLKKAHALIDSLPELTACFIYNNNGKLAFDYTKGWPK